MAGGKLVLVSGRTRKRTTTRVVKRRASPRMQRSIKTVFPKLLTVKLPYAQYVQLPTKAAPAPTFNDWRANGIFDPDASLGGHQPLGMDQWQEFYNHYVVKSSTIKFTVLSQLSSPATMYICGIYLADDITVPTDYQTLMEQPHCKYKIFNAGSSEGGGFMQTIRHSFNAKTYFNLKDVRDNITRIGASFVATPIEQAFYHCFVYNMDTGTAVQAIHANVEITYNVSLSEPKSITGS